VGVINLDCLYIVMPAYNEEANIQSVAREWHEIVEKIGHESRLVIVDDGSKDSTYATMQQLQGELACFVPLTKANGGHGATCLYAYQYALTQKADYIFQTDSDGQTVPAEFWTLWEQRDAYGVQIGHRKHRQDGFSRVFVTKTLKLVLRVVFGLKITDANTPFRLMKAEILQKYIGKVPENYNLANVLLTVLFEKGKEAMRYIPITFRPRQGGVNSINMRKIAKIGYQAFKDFRTLKKLI